MIHLELNAANLTLIFLVLGNLVAFVVAATTLRTSVNNLKSTTVDMKATLQDIVRTLGLHSAEILVLKSDTKKTESEVLLQRDRIHDISGDVIQPMLMLVHTLADKVKIMVDK